ncbi:hypothetical protein PAPHI01_0709 [Pancytospora philotis]|nr:hypothetical protein PAPHI01_0709 [Pancytospora philotis]
MIGLLCLCSTAAGYLMVEVPEWPGGQAPNGSRSELAPSGGSRKLACDDPVGSSSYIECMRRPDQLPGSPAAPDGPSPSRGSFTPLNTDSPLRQQPGRKPINNKPSAIYPSQQLPRSPDHGGGRGTRKLGILVPTPHPGISMPVPIVHPPIMVAPQPRAPPAPASAKPRIQKRLSRAEPRTTTVVHTTTVTVHAIKPVPAVVAVQPKVAVNRTVTVAYTLPPEVVTTTEPAIVMQAPPCTVTVAGPRTTVHDVAPPITVTQSPVTVSLTEKYTVPPITTTVTQITPPETLYVPPSTQTLLVTSTPPPVVMLSTEIVTVVVTVTSSATASVAPRMFVRVVEAPPANYGPQHSPAPTVRVNIAPPSQHGQSQPAPAMPFALFPMPDSGHPNSRGNSLYMRPSEPKLETPGPRPQWELPNAITQPADNNSPSPSGDNDGSRIYLPSPIVGPQAPTQEQQPTAPSNACPFGASGPCLGTLLTGAYSQTAANANGGGCSQLNVSACESTLVPRYPKRRAPAYYPSAGTQSTAEPMDANQDSDEKTPAPRQNQQLMDRISALIANYKSSASSRPAKPRPDGDSTEVVLLSDLLQGENAGNRAES